MDCNGLYWAVLGSSKSLGNTGLNWALMDCNELYWTVLGCSELSWIVLGCNVCIWY